MSDQPSPPVEDRGWVSMEPAGGTGKVKGFWGKKSVKAVGITSLILGLFALVFTCLLVPGMQLSSSQTPVLQKAGFTQVNVDLTSMSAHVGLGGCNIRIYHRGGQWLYFPNDDKPMSVVVTTPAALEANTAAGLAGCN